MSTLINAELRKILFKKSIFITWIISLLLATMIIHNGTINEVYADAFFKSYGYTPIMGLVMFMVLSGSYTMEYNSNMRDLINTTKNGKRKLVIAKGIGAGIAASIINLSILITIYVDAINKANFKGLDTPLKNLWYFKGISSDLNVLQMMIIVSTTVVIASFFFAQLCLYLSSISKTASFSFIFSGVIMGIPYLLASFLPERIIVLTPLFGMISSQLIKYNIGLDTIIFQGAVFIIGSLVFLKLTFSTFIKESKR